MIAASAADGVAVLAHKIKVAVPASRRIEVVLPADFPIGQAELIALAVTPSPVARGFATAREIVGSLSRAAFSEHVGHWIVVHEGAIIRVADTLADANDGLPRSRIADYLVMFVDDEPAALLET